MEKVKLNISNFQKETTYKNIIVNNIEITVTPVIPYEKVIEMIQWAANKIIDDRPYISGPVRRIVTDLAVIKYYTNLDLDELDNNDPKLMVDFYDILTNTEIISQVTSLIEKRQLDFFEASLFETLENICKYQHSIIGIVDDLADKTSALSIDIKEITKNLNSDQVKEIMKFIEQSKTQN